MFSLDPPLVPKNGRALQVILVCRVSDPRAGKQDIRSLEDQQALLTGWLKQRTDQPVETTLIAGSGSGELLGRDEYERLIDAVETRRFDLVLAEDLGRVVRRIHAVLFCEHCVDKETRMIALNDNIDTARPGWQDSSIFSAWHHERSNRDSSDRIKRAHRSRFMNGGCLPTLIYGYIKPVGAKSDAELRKDPDAEAVYQRWFEMLDAGATFAEIADWLNRESVPPPPYVRNDHWTDRVVGRHTRNPMLKGIRERNRRKTKRNNATGQYRSVKADPQELLQREVPHLAFFEASYYDRILAKVNRRNAKCRRTDDERDDPRRGIPKKRSRYPGQCVYCGICGRLYVYGGHGRRDHLMCTGAREHCCWVGTTVDGPLAARKISAAVWAQIESLPQFDDAFADQVNAEARRLDGERERAMRELDRQIADIDRSIGNLLAFLRAGNHSETVAGDLQRLEASKAQLAAERAELEQRPRHVVDVPSIEQLKQYAENSLMSLAVDSFEFARAMRQLTPRIVVFPYRLCDGGGLALRAKLRLRLANLIPNAPTAAALDHPLERLITVDLFDPPQRAAYREQVINLRAAGLTEKEAATQLGITGTAAQYAAALHRKMTEQGLHDPYVPVTEPPPDVSKLRRHLHPRYRFQPLPDAGQL